MAALFYFSQKIKSVSSWILFFLLFRKKEDSAWHSAQEYNIKKEGVNKLQAWENVTQPTSVQD